MPFANLLTVSYTGVLFPLPEEVLGRKKSRKFKIGHSHLFCYCFVFFFFFKHCLLDSESAILEGNEIEPVPPRCDSFSRLLCAGDPVTAKIEASGEVKEPSESKSEENVEVEAVVTKGMEEMSE